MRVSACGRPRRQLGWRADRYSRRVGKGLWMITRRQTLALLGASAGALVLPQTRSARAASSTLRVGWQKFGVLALAKSSGALEKRLADQGVTIEWHEFTSGPPTLEAVGSGALDFGVTGDVPPLFAQA